MTALEERIRINGIVVDDEILRVDRFLTHQMDINLFIEMGQEWMKRFGHDNVTKILTVESTGLGIACVAAEQFHCPAVFAKRGISAGDVYSTEIRSYWENTVSPFFVSKQFLRPEDKVLLIDDFLANGAVLEGLIDLVQQSGATLVGAGVAVEKVFQNGGEKIREKGVRVEALARVKRMSSNGGIEFC